MASSGSSSTMTFSGGVSVPVSSLPATRRDDAGDFPGDSGDGVHPGLNRPNPTFPDLCR